MLSAARSTAARDLGMQDLFADAEHNTVLFFISEAARKLKEITSDDAWKGLEASGIQSLDRPNTMGAAFRTAASQGLITATDRIRKSCRVSAHRRNVQVWRSLVFKGGLA
jgi:hypothetical protein